MKKYSAGFLPLLLITLTIVLVASNFISSNALASHQTTDGISLQQTTPLAQVEYETGLTDGILIMGLAISLIVTLPLFFRKK